MNEVKAERLVQAVERIATCLESISKSLEPKSKRTFCQPPQQQKDHIDDMTDEEILKAANELPDDDLPNPYPDPNK